MNYLYPWTHLFLLSHRALTFISLINTHQTLINHDHQNTYNLNSTCCTPPVVSTPSLSPTSLSVFLTLPHRQPLLPHPPLRVSCCRITLCLLRFVLCSRPITTTGEVTGVGLHMNYAVNDARIYCKSRISLIWLRVSRFCKTLQDRITLYHHWSS